MNDDNPGGPFAGALQEGERILWQGDMDVKLAGRWRVRMMKRFEYLGIIITPFVVVLLYYMTPEVDHTCLWLYLIIGCVVFPIISHVFIWPRMENSFKPHHYVLTDRRILQHTQGTTASKYITEIPKVTLRMHDMMRGIGSVRFGKLSESMTPGEGILFDTIPDAQKVYDTLVEAREKATRENQRTNCSKSSR